MAGAWLRQYSFGILLKDTGVSFLAQAGAKWESAGAAPNDRPLPIRLLSLADSVGCGCVAAPMCEADSIC